MRWNLPFFFALYTGGGRSAAMTSSVAKKNKKFDPVALVMDKERKEKGLSVCLFSFDFEYAKRIIRVVKSRFLAAAPISITRFVISFDAIVRSGRSV
jgi:hypothetical protein